MAMLPDNMRLTDDEVKELEEIRQAARILHEKERKAARGRGRKDFPASPYECSWAYEQEFFRSKRY